MAPFLSASPGSVEGFEERASAAEIPGRDLRLLAALALPCFAIAQGSYHYQPVEFPGADGSQIFGINERGQAAGNAFFLAEDGSGFEASIPFTDDTRKDRFALVDDVAGFDGTSILAISSRGDLVGGVDDDAASRRRGLLLDKRGNAHVFDHPEAVFETTARGINSKGLITGIRDTADPLQFLASFIYDPSDGTFTDVVPSLLTIAQGINSRGDVVGSAIFFTEDDPCNPGAPPTGTVRYGWLRSDDGNVRFFTVNGLRTSARGITGSGTITGFIQDPATGTQEGFVTEIGDGQCQDITVDASGLVVFPGAPATFPADINNAGAVVGQYNAADGSPQSFVARRR